MKFALVVQETFISFATMPVFHHFPPLCSIVANEWGISLMTI
jgi:hypothetical protein